jgi:hypothetical protein
LNSTKRELTIYDSINQLVVHPEAVDACREEIREILKDSDGVMTTNALFHMKLVDSVMREAQRLSPPFLGKLHTPSHIPTLHHHDDVNPRLTQFLFQILSVAILLNLFLSRMVQLSQREFS